MDEAYPATTATAPQPSPGRLTVERHPGPDGTAIHLALAGSQRDGALPAGGGLRLCPAGIDESRARALSRRLAQEMLVKHRLHRTGFVGAKIVVSGARAIDDDLLHAVAEVLNQRLGQVYTGVDLGTGEADMIRLARLTPYVLSALGSPVDPGIATAFGVLGALDAFTGGRLADHSFLVHGTGKVGTPLAMELAAEGARVLTYDVRPEAAAVPGCHPVTDWHRHPVDILVPCSTNDLVDMESVTRLRCRAVIGAANAVLAGGPATAGLLHRRGITHLPSPLTNAGAVIVDSIEHYAPEAFASAPAHLIYGFVRTTIRRAADDLLRTALYAGRPPTVVLDASPVPLASGVCGRDFAAFSGG